MKLMLNGKEVSGMGHYVMAGDIKDATAEDSNVLSGKSYYNNNGKREGTMPNRGGMSAELAAGGSVSILEGYHNGEGVVRAQDLASQTAGDAGAGNIDSGKTAWVNGAQVTGTSTKVDTSGATATAADIASGKTAWVNGAQVTGDASIDPWKVVKTFTIDSDDMYCACSSNKNYLRITDLYGLVTIVPLYIVYRTGVVVYTQKDVTTTNSITIAKWNSSSVTDFRISSTMNLYNCISKVEEVSLS